MARGLTGSGAKRYHSLAKSDVFQSVLALVAAFQGKRDTRRAHAPIFYV